MNSQMYIKLINDQLEEHTVHITWKNWIFQQNNASIHTVKSVQNYFSTKKKVLVWPEYSPDLNIIENV